MRVVAVTKIFPNSLEPLSSPFNLQQFAALQRLCDIEVIVPIPYIPGAAQFGRPKRAAMLAALPKIETNSGITTHIMRQIYLPKVGLAVALPLFLSSLAPYRSLLAQADVILGTWAFPDGCAATLAAKMLGKPVVVKVHGSDVNVVAQDRFARSQIAKILPRADAVVAVSVALADELARIGVPREKLHLVRNGVDTRVFYPRDKMRVREALGLALPGQIVTFVGRIEPQKGVTDLMAAFEIVLARKPTARLVLVGDGVLRDGLGEHALVRQGAVLLVGPKPLAKVADYIAAADVFTLPSHAEGTPNVVLEALASGRPVVGSRVGGIPDVLADPETGIVVEAKDPKSLAAGLLAAMDQEWNEDAIVAAGPTSWAESAKALYDVLVSARDTNSQLA
jgi:glycosyltransferase involved in cell wall biosynthesis